MTIPAKTPANVIAVPTIPDSFCKAKIKLRCVTRVESVHGPAIGLNIVFSVLPANMHPCKMMHTLYGGYLSTVAFIKWGPNGIIINWSSQLYWNVAACHRLIWFNCFYLKSYLRDSELAVEIREHSWPPKICSHYSGLSENDDPKRRNAN